MSEQVKPVAHSDYIAWKKDPITKMMLLGLDGLAKSEMNAWAAKNLKGENHQETVVLESEARGRLQGYRNIMIAVHNNQLVPIQKEEEDE